MPTYVTCFSVNGDLLSQWRAYADDGQGVAIGFSSSHLKKQFQHFTDIFKVVYEPDMHRWAVERFVPLVQIDSFLGTTLFGELYWVSALAYTASCKNKAFESEMEFRLIHVPLYEENESDSLGRLTQSYCERVKYRVNTRNQIVPYIPFPISLSDRETPPILAMQIGPRNNDPLLQPAIEMMLDSYGAAVEACQITKSELTYR